VAEFIARTLFTPTNTTVMTYTQCRTYSAHAGRDIKLMLNVFGTHDQSVKAVEGF